MLFILPNNMLLLDKTWTISRETSSYYFFCGYNSLQGCRLVGFIFSFDVLCLILLQPELTHAFSWPLSLTALHHWHLLLLQLESVLTGLDLRIFFRITYLAKSSFLLSLPVCESSNLSYDPIVQFGVLKVQNWHCLWFCFVWRLIPEHC